MVGHHRRHNSYVKAIKCTLEKKKTGEIVAVNGGESEHSDDYDAALMGAIVWAMPKHDAYYDIPWHTQIGAGGVVWKSWHTATLVMLTLDQILTNAIHDLDMLQYWLGDITGVFALEGPKECPYAVDSTVQLSLKFSSGIVGSLLLTK